MARRNSIEEQRGNPRKTRLEEITDLFNGYAAHLIERGIIRPLPREPEGVDGTTSLNGNQERSEVYRQQVMVWQLVYRKCTTDEDTVQMADEAVRQVDHVSGPTRRQAATWLGFSELNMEVPDKFLPTMAALHSTLLEKARLAGHWQERELLQMITFPPLVPRQPELASCWENLSKLRWRHVFPTKAPELAECEVLLRFVCNGRIRALGRSPNIMLVMKNETSLFHVSRPDQNTINNGSIRGMNYICVSAARDPVSIASRTEAGNMVNTTEIGRAHV